jgi:hypothetical protein
MQSHYYIIILRKFSILQYFNYGIKILGKESFTKICFSIKEKKEEMTTILVETPLCSHYWSETTVIEKPCIIF